MTQNTPVDVPTARGDVISSSELGFTLMHEHVFVADAEVHANWPDTWGDDEQRITDAIEALKVVKEAGVDTIVDVSVIGHGRNVARVARIAREIELNIVVATGMYTSNTLPYFFSLFGPGAYIEAPEGMTDFFVRDIEQGIGDTGVKAGILKVASGNAGMTNGVERSLRSVAQAHLRTGVPITTHTETQDNGLDQQRIFKEEGVDLNRVIIGHTDSTSQGDVVYVEKLLENGSYVGLDTFGFPIMADDIRVDLLVALLERGHADRIVISHDDSVFNPLMPSEWRQPSQRKSFFVEEIVPQLLERGATQAQIDTITRDNPRRIFETRGLGAY